MKSLVRNRCFSPEPKQETFIGIPAVGIVIAILSFALSNFHSLQQPNQRKANMGSPEYATAASETISESVKASLTTTDAQVERAAKLAAVGKILGVALTELLDNDTDRADAILHYAAGFAHGVGQSKETIIAKLNEIFAQWESAAEPPTAEPTTPPATP